MNMKITKYFLSMAAAVGMIAGCHKQEMVQIVSPEDVVAPVLEAVEGPIEITPSNLGFGDVTLSWSLADYGVPTQIDYSVEAAAAANPNAKVIITSGVVASAKEREAGKISTKLTYETLNAVLFNDLKLEDGVAAEVLFTVGSKVGESAKTYSNAVNVICKVTASEKQYPKIWVVGDYCGWNHGNSQYLFDFEGDDAVYQGVIDFGEKAANGWKITGVGSWDDTCNWGGDEAVTYEPEAATTQLINGGGSKDLKHYSKRFYHFSYEKATLLLTKTIGFDNIGVVGTFNGWSEVNNTDMNFNTAKQKFYADVEFTEDGEFKFNVDKAWAISFGLGEEGFLTTENGGNIAVPAGKYRIYLVMNNYKGITYEINPKMYGQEEGTATGGQTPETPETPDGPSAPVMTGWGIVGSITNWGNKTEDNTYIPDVALASDGTWHVAKGVAIPEGAEIKFRKDGDWATQWGLGADPFAANAEMTLSSDGGSGNIAPAAGTYDIYLNPETGKVWFITDGSYPGGSAAPEASEWGIVGDVNNWGNTAGVSDIVMYKTATEGLFVAYKVEMPAGGFKIRANNEWNDAKNYGLSAAGNVEVDHAYDVITSGGSGDMKIAAGTYDIWFDLTNEKVYIMTPGKAITEAQGGSSETPSTPNPEVGADASIWGVVGDVNGWVAPDITMYKTSVDGLFVARDVQMPAGGFKIRANNEWNDEANYGVEVAGAVSVNHSYTLINGAGSQNMTLAAGTYDIWFDLTNLKIYIMSPGKSISEAVAGTPVPPMTSEWYLVGDFNGWSPADPTYKMTAEGAWYVFKNFTANGKGVKFVADSSWSVNRGGTFSGANTAIALNQGGADMMIAAGTYDVYLSADASTAYFMTPGTTPAN
jgi:hypothetical protein